MGIRALCFAPYDVVTVQREDQERMYEVTGCHLGGLGQESLVTMVSWSAKPGYVHGSGEELIVPEYMLHSMIEAGRARVSKAVKEPHA